MGKLIAIIAVAGLVAGAGAYGLVYHTDSSCPGHVDPADCPVVKVGGCPYCTGASPAASTESDTADACCADTGSVAHAAGGKDSAAAAVAGPAAMFTSTTKTKKACCCCAEEPTALTALVGVAATAK